jgi:hypothetical protein
MATIGHFKVESESTVVIFDELDGRIVHRHDVVTAVGGKHPDEKTREQDALAQMKHAQPEFTRKTALLHVDARTLKPQTLFKVDVNKRVLVEQPFKSGSRFPRTR